MTTTEATRKMALVIGDTFTVRGRLSGAGWHWVPEKKGWTKDVPADWDAGQVESDIRCIGGIRNRMGKVRITF